jgi:hypothetical protein
MFQKPTLFPFSGKEVPNLLDPLDQAILSLGTIQTVHLLRNAPENRPSPRVVRGKLKINYTAQK